MAEVQISAEPRTEFGKGAARRIRRSHKVPGVLYEHGNVPLHITLPGHELMLALKTPNVLLGIELDDRTELAIPKDVQRDPIKGLLEHVDLLIVRRGEKVRVEVGLLVTGDPVPDAMVAQELNTIEVLAEATDIPSGFEVDITGLPIGSQVLAKEIALPPGVELVTEPEYLAVNIIPVPVTAEPQEEAETVEGAAPAAEAAAPSEGESAPAEGAE